MNRSSHTRHDKPRVYIAAPFKGSNDGPTFGNARRAIQIAEDIIRIGAVPFIPHLNGFWEIIFPHGEDFWIEWDLAWLAVCDATYVPDYLGYSRGRDIEMKMAEKLGIPIFRDMHKLREFIDGWTGDTDDTAAVRDEDPGGVP
jgi:hypothetical protein